MRSDARKRHEAAREEGCGAEGDTVSGHSAVTLYDFFDGRITLRVAMPQPQYNTVQLNAEYKGDLISVDVDIDDLRAAIAAVDVRSDSEPTS